MIRLIAATTVAAGLSLAGSAIAQDATASMSDPNGNDVGTVTFERTPSGMVHVIAELSDLPPGTHGFHVHETGECDAAGVFESAGGHYAGGKEHGVMSENGPHPGDFPNVTADGEGSVKVEYFTDRLALGADGDNPLMDDDGSAVVVHSGADDYESQPSGDAGDRIACGVIEDR